MGQILDSGLSNKVNQPLKVAPQIGDQGFRREKIRSDEPDGRGNGL